jgi:hypothetical protein
LLFISYHRNFTDEAARLGYFPEMSDYYILDFIGGDCVVPPVTCSIDSYVICLIGIVTLVKLILTMPSKVFSDGQRDEANTDRAKLVPQVNGTDCHRIAVRRHKHGEGL